MNTDLLFYTLRVEFEEQDIACELYKLAQEEYRGSEKASRAIPWILFKAGRLFEKQTKDLQLLDTPVDEFLSETDYAVEVGKNEP